MQRGKGRIAIVQERFGAGGREKVVAAMIEVLNSMGITPDVITLQSTITSREVSQLFGSRIDYNVLKLPDLLPSVLSGAEAPYTNLLANLWTRKHDGVINLNSSMAFCSSRVPTIFYVTVPERFIVLSQRAGREAGFWSRWRDRLHRALVRRFDIVKAGFIVVSLCEHTRDLLQSVHPGIETAVLYPPVDAAVFENRVQKENIIVNLGRYATQKRQLDLLAQAKHLPDYQFIFMGPGQGSRYFQRCRDYVKEQGLANVELKGLAPLTELRSTLARAMFYVHMFRSEPFGMATAEAIAAGCIPVVPDSWGNREIVVKPELRFKQDQEIVSIIRNIEGNPARAGDYRADLQKHVQKFDKAVFTVEFQRLVDELISSSRPSVN
ncbi:MAG TPA: glycosyltransferase family 4 protein [Acidobacteriota bacterium]|jgi:glycosyltransferase involved in cell wall biosynthesis